MEIKLNEIQLENFKGVKSFLFTPMGKSAAILGRNRRGKTTVGTGFRWVLADKDMEDKSVDVKTKDPKTGEAIHNLEHSVRTAISVDGEPLELKKVFTEDWGQRGKKRGILIGHTTKHYIDGKFMKATKWAERMAALVDPEVLRLVTSTTYYKSLHWQALRDILFEIGGRQFSDREVLESNPELSGLIELIGDGTIDDYKTDAKERKAKIEKRKAEIIPSIKELMGQLPEVNNRKAVEAVIKILDDRIEKAKDNSELSGLRSELALKKCLLAEARLKHDDDVRGAKGIINARIDMAQDTIRKLKGEINAYETADRASLRAIEGNRQEMAKLRAKYSEIMAQEPPESTICPTCGQTFPEEQIEAARAKFNENKALELAAINDEGKALKAENQTLAKSLTISSDKIRGLKSEIEKQEAEIEAAEGDRVENPQPSNPMLALQEQIAKLQEVIEAKPQTDTKALESERREEMGKLAALDQAEKTKARIEELKAEETNLSAKLETFEGEFDLLDRFATAKVEMLEEPINAKFEVIKWKLFRPLVNGGHEPCCIPMINGSTDLSFSENIQAGLDFVRAASEHYQVWGPVFIDNASEITQPLEIPSQTISLIVSPDHPEMEVRY